MKKWIVLLVVIIIVAGLGYVFRHSIKSLFAKAPAQTPTTVVTDPTANWQTYASSTMGISIKYPGDYQLNASYTNTTVNPKKPISGISLTIPASMATGTNLSTDTKLSVEQLPRAKTCTGDIFLAANVVAVDKIDNGMTYSVATSSDAAAGNRYEETVYAIKGSQPCTAVRYFVHYGAIENYPAGAVQQFDSAGLMNAFDGIRRTLQLTGTTPAPTQ
jgi:hypothetical protein